MGETMITPNEISSAFNRGSYGLADILKLFEKKIADLEKRLLKIESEKKEDRETYAQREK